MNQELPKTITDRLHAVLHRVRRIQFARGLLGVLSCTLAAVLLIMAVDYFFSPLEQSLRWGLFIFLLAVLMGSFWKLFLVPLNQRIELLQIARWLEIKHPEIQERISTAMELSGTSGAGISTELLEEIVSEAEVDVLSLNPQVEVKAKKLKAWIWPACALAAIFLTLFLVWPDQVSRLLVRAVAPFSKAGNAGAVAFDIQPGDIEVLEGDTVKIRILYDGPENDTLTLVSTRDDKTITEEKLTVSGTEDGKRLVEYELSSASDSFQYRIRAGRNESDTHKVTVWPRPRIAGLESTYDFPSYTGLARKKQNVGMNGISTLTGTEVQLQAAPNTPVDSGVLMVNDQKIADINIENNASGGRMTCTFPMHKDISGTGKIILTHRLGHVIEVASFPVQSVADEAPAVSLLTPVKRELRVRKTDELPITYLVTEKIGLQAAELTISVNEKSVQPMPLVLPERGKRDQWNGKLLLAIGTITDKYPDARKLVLRIRIRDNCPPEFGGPNIGLSEKIELRITRGAESLVRQELKAQQSDIREAVEKAEKDIRKAVDQMRQAEHQIQKEEMPEHARQQLEKARENLAEAEKELAELAEKMENTVHAQKTEDVEKAAQESKESREKLETAPLQNTPEERKKELNEAKKDAEDALEALQDLKKKMDQDRQKVEDIARLNELAQKERELARQAEAMAREAEQQDQQTDKQADKQAEREAQKLANEQRQVSEEIRRELNERPEAVAEAAKQQAEQARDLAEQARELEKQQEALEDIAKDAQQADDAEAQQAREDAIREQIKKAQEDIVEQAKEQLNEARQNQEQRANELPEAVENAERAKEQIAKKNDADAAEAARDAAEQLKDAAQPENNQANPEDNPKGDRTDQADQQQQQNQNKEQNAQQDAQDADAPEQNADQGADQGDAKDEALEQLAEQQGKVAEALEALEQGNVDEAQQALQELQAEAAEALEQDVQALPEINGKTGEMQQAEQAAKQGEQQAQQAAEQAENGNQQAAAENNAEAAEQLGKAADALDQHAEKMEALAEQAAAKAQSKQAQQAAQNQAPADGKQLAEAFQKAAEAAESAESGSPQEAAEAARNAADALSELAQQAMQSMQQGTQPGQKGQQQGPPMADGEPSNKPGDDPKEGMRIPEPDPGVPPELAKLGVSAADWEKLKEMMKSDVGAAAGSDIPEDYRNLVRRYFQQIANEGKEQP